MKLALFLERKLKQYNQPDFIASDPISVPHAFSKKQDIEIMGFFAALFAWGQRVTIINKCKDLIQRMQGEPFEFVKGHSEQDLKKLVGFRHRTFNDTDLLYVISFLKYWYGNHPSLESAFSGGLKPSDSNIEPALNYFRTQFFAHAEAPGRTRKHISAPVQNSACKRLNMYLRWMVRNDNKGVDFGLWESIKTRQLVCPLDVHVQRVALELGLLQRSQSDWKAAVELTENLKTFDAHDPVKYDLALFGLGVEEGLNRVAAKRFR